jgi:uncharacterized protein
MSNPCLSCGACCAYFRASFHWLETSAAEGGLTPIELTVPVTAHCVAMRGSDRKPPRCIALEGSIGEAVRCSIYPLRASPCRNFQAAWVNGEPNERCDRARAAHGLPPLAPAVSPLVADLQSAAAMPMTGEPPALECAN